MKVPRISQKYLKQYGDQEITDLVNEYYVMFDSTEQEQGGMQLNVSEVLAIKKHLKGRKFKNLLEIGVCDGGSLWLYVNLFCDKDSTITAIDQRFTKCEELVIGMLRSRVKKITFICENCNDINAGFKNKSFDFIHIDADHHYPAVKQIFDTYIHKLSKDGIILIHDTNSDDGTKEFVEKEIVEQYDYKEFIGKGYIASQRECGIDEIETGTIIIRRKKWSMNSQY